MHHWRAVPFGWAKQAAGGAQWIVAGVVATIATAVDGAFLGGVAAIISACGSLILGALAYWRGHRKGSTKDDVWRPLAEQLLEENAELKARLEQPRADG